MGDAGFIEIGYIQRTHGIKGEMLVTFDADQHLDPEKLESVFVEIDGIPVPFFITSLNIQRDSKAIVKLSEVDSIDQAEHFVGFKLVIPGQATSNTDEIYFSDLVGFSVYLSQGDLFGTITLYTDYGLNATFDVLTPTGKQVIIPAAEELINEIDVPNRKIEMNLPEGLLDLNA